MKNYPAKSNKRKPPVETERFDKSKLTASDLELLNDFKERRREFNRLLEESNIIHYKKTCPGCGYPAMDADEFFNTCVLCLWEGDASDKHETLQGPPNYISLIEQRIKVSRFLREFLKAYEIETSIDALIKSIRDFETGPNTIDRENFETNLKHILPAKPKQ
jgi:hypothetical protein